MGVRGLETFMEKNKTTDTVDIVRLIREFREQNDSVPVIVIDGMSVMRDIYKSSKKNRLSWIYGGQMKEYKELLEEFINTFRNEGAELVFYFDGPCVSSKKETWVKRRYDTLRNVYSLLDSMAQGDRIDSLEDKRWILIVPASLKASTVYIAKKCQCKVYTSVRECDLEIAEYAARNKCMAILAQDSDYAIFHSAKYYLSMKNFNFNNMTTVNYNREKLASFLGIQTDHLPLFASLVGNDVIPSGELKHFHEKVLGKSFGYRVNFNELLPKVAKFVSRWPTGFDVDDESLKTVAEEVFSDHTKSSLIHDSILSYDLSSQRNAVPDPPSSEDKNWDNILKKLYDLNKTADTPTLIYSIMILQEYTCSTCVEDYRKNDIPATQTMLKPLREKFYGILLHEKPNSTSEPVKVQEMVVCSETSLDQPVYVQAIKPKVHHPGLLALWEDGVKEERWALVGDIFGVDYKEIRALPLILIIPALTMRYIHDRVSIKDWELKALVSSAVLVHIYSTDYLSNIKAPVVIKDTRPIRLFTLVSRSYSTTQFIFQGLGNPIPAKMIQPSNYQDGKLFHHKYDQVQHAKDGDLELCDRKEEALQLFDEVMNFVLHKEN